ncbi:hypothetical protein F441_12611 [Phytophthora nicotianae CJ01A1]|uniref:Uncharacterized protein n=3 Tax=Phytophthora nicotianae TaxID=4792 RepID=W2WN33_PHYNI|nr:hypothetical protein L916_12284 [Phytophthora nicotianae]ETP11926.1 hypothetical protein F441_12611 [Phytophthora nicotianae CJ01A1]
MASRKPQRRMLKRCDGLGCCSWKSAFGAVVPHTPARRMYNKSKMTGLLMLVIWIPFNGCTTTGLRGTRAALFVLQQAVATWKSGGGCTQRGGKEQSGDMDSQAALEIADAHNHLDVVEWFQAHQKACNPLDCDSGYQATSRADRGSEQVRCHFMLKYPVSSVVRWIRRACGDHSVE